MTKCDEIKDEKLQYYINREAAEVRGGSRTAATSQMEPFVITVNAWKLLTIITKRSILDVTSVLDLRLKISALSSVKIDKYEYIAGEEILPSDQSRIIEQAKFIYSPLGWRAREKQVEALEVLKPNTQNLTIKDVIPEKRLHEKAKIELNKIKDIEEMVERENLVYRKNECMYSSKNVQTISTFGRDICNGTITLKEAYNDQSD